MLNICLLSYRLGLLGCAAGPKLLEDNKHSGEAGVGNYGLRDQRQALEWVHHFIADFGGDGSNITLFGASTGASDILSHLSSSSNASYPLFARAVVQSPVIDHTVPSIALAGVHLSKVMSALHISTIQELRKVPVDKLVNFTPGSRAVDDEVFFENGHSESRVNEGMSQSHLRVPEKLAAQCIVEQRIVDRHGTHLLRTSAKVIQILHHDDLAPIPRPAVPAGSQQPVIIGDCGYESSVNAAAASAWTPTAAIRRVGAICQSVKRANALLRAYDISAHTPDDEFPERLLELINDARFAWPIHLAAESLRRSRSAPKDSSGVWRYVFDQDAPGSGIPQHATDLLYLFDTARPAFTAQSLIAAPDPDAFFPDRFDVDDDEDDDDVPFDNSAFEDADGDGDLLSSIDQYQYMAVRDALQSRWLSFAYGAAPWARDKVFVFGPEGEAGERGSNIFEGRRRTEAWRTALEPLGRAIVQKVGLELSNGPSGAQLMQRQMMLEEHQHQLYVL
jgi:carboxylesterase type B